jgi:pimeloyl-ACP methyl ester carboxylesterase
LGFPLDHFVHGAAAERLRGWIESVRGLEKRHPKSYPSPEAAMTRMKEVNPRLSDELARHLTLHGTNWESDGSLLWKFDNYLRAIPPYGHHVQDAEQLYGAITSPVQMFWGLESFLPVPENDPRFQAIPRVRLLKIAHAGHWVHHDQLALFLREATAFLKG